MFKKFKRLFKKNTSLVIGENNRLVIVDEKGERDIKNFNFFKGLKINIKGNNNIIKIHASLKSNKSEINMFCDESEIVIGKDCQLGSTIINCTYKDKMKLIIGNNVTVNTLLIIMQNQAHVTIGEDCMFATHTAIWATDGHAITDVNTGQIINETAPNVVIGDHCWIDEWAILTKNAKLPAGTVVGLRAVITKEFKEQNTIIAGNPAKVVKTNVRWHRSTVSGLKNMYEQKRGDYV